VWALQDTGGVLDDPAARAGNLDEFMIGHVEQPQQPWIGGIVRVNRIEAERTIQDKRRDRPALWA
jgi:hypothetical protein